MYALPSEALMWEQVDPEAGMRRTLSVWVQVAVAAAQQTGWVPLAEVQAVKVGKSLEADRSCAFRVEAQARLA